MSEDPMPEDPVPAGPVPEDPVPEDPAPEDPPNADAARVRALFEADRYAASLGIRLVDADPTTVRVEMPVRQDHLNFYDVTHGGALFSLADCAFSLASNAHGDRAVAIDTHLALTAGTTEGDTLRAVAEEMTRGRTIATYRITVSRSDGRTCGLFTGTVHVTRSG